MVASGCSLTGRKGRNSERPHLGGTKKKRSASRHTAVVGSVNQQNLAGIRKQLVANRQRLASNCQQLACNRPPGVYTSLNKKRKRKYVSL